MFMSRGTTDFLPNAYRQARYLQTDESPALPDPVSQVTNHITTLHPGPIYSLPPLISILQPTSPHQHLTLERYICYVAEDIGQLVRAAEHIYEGPSSPI
jgi:hypothetical protein